MSCCFSTLKRSGTTNTAFTSSWPAATAKPIPVLPAVGSMTVPPGGTVPSSSIRSSMYVPMRSLIDAPGLNDSSLAYTGTSSGAACTRTRGVSPTVSSTESRGSRWVVIRWQRLPRNTYLSIAI